MAIKEFFPAGFATRQDATKIISIGGEQQRIFNIILKKFRDTTTYLAELDHPNIVKVHGYHDEGSTAYMLMEFIEGTTIRNWRNDPKKKFTAKKFRSVVKPILSALIYLHKNKMYHRDLSPENILVDKNEKPVIIDFGAVKQELDDLKKEDKTGVTSSLVIGRDDYAPPEQLRLFPTPIGAYTDIYSIAVVMYELLCQERPPNAATRVGAKARDGHDNNSYVPVADKSKVKLKQAEFLAIDKALSLNPEDRFQSVQDFGNAGGWLDKKQKSVIPNADDGNDIDDPGFIDPPKSKLPYVLVAGAVAMIVGAFIYLNAGNIFQKLLDYIKDGKSFQVSDYCNNSTNFENIVVSKHSERLENYIKECGDNGSFAANAKDLKISWQNDEDAWNSVRFSANSNDVKLLYIDKFHNGLHIADAKALFAKLKSNENTESDRTLQEQKLTSAIQNEDINTLKQIASGVNFALAERANEAIEKIQDKIQNNEEDILYLEVIYSNDISELKRYTKNYPLGKYIDKVEAQIAKIREDEQDNNAWQRALEQNTLKFYQDYLNEFPNGKYAQQAKNRINEITLLDNSCKSTNASDDKLAGDAYSVVKQYLVALGEPDINKMFELWHNPNSKVSKRINRRSGGGFIHTSIENTSTYNFYNSRQDVVFLVDAKIETKVYNLSITLDCIGDDWKIVKWDTQ